MQCFLRKVVANNHNLRHSHRIVHRTDVLHSAASSLPKPQLGHHISPSLHHFHSSRWRSLSTIVCGAFNSRNAFLRNSTARVFFRRQSFNFVRDYDFNRRGWRSWFHRLSADNMVFGLIVANVAIFLLWRIADKKFMINNFTISLDNLKSGRLHTLITNAFSHVDTWHIISNMIGLYFFGLNVGRNFGPEFLLKLYLAGAVGGSVFYLMHQAYKARTSKDWRAMIAQKELALGASGAVNAVMLLDIFLFPKATLYLDFFIPVPAILLGIFLIGKDMLRIIEGDSRISGAAHLGGVAVAAIAWARVRRGRF